MKFLVISRPKAGASIGLADVQKAMEQGKELTESGISENVYGFVNGGAVAYYNVESAEHLWQVLHESALYNQMDWHVEPLVDIAHIGNAMSLAANQ